MKAKFALGLFLAAVGLSVWGNDAAAYPGWRILGTGAAAYAAPTGEDTSVTAFAGLSADREKAFVLVADYRGSGPLVAHIDGLGDATIESALVLDHTRDLEPVAVTWKDGVLTLPRRDENSAAFYVVLKRAK